MNLRTKLLYLAAVLVIALPLVLTGNAGARYFKDGAVQNGVTGGWITPNDMVCILGVRTNGNLDIVGGVTNSRECIYYTTGLTTMNPVNVTSVVDGGGTYDVVSKPLLNTYGKCKDPGSGGNSSYVWDFVSNRCLDVTKCSGTDAVTKGTLTWNAGSSTCSVSVACTVAGYSGSAGTNDGAKHALATSICVDSLGNGIPLTDLDRTFAMCAAKGGTWKQTSDSLIVSGSGALATATVQVPATLGFGGACVAYGRQFAGQDANGAPLAFGPKGTTSAQAGYCYAPMNMTTAFQPTPATLCPMSDNNTHPNAGFNSSTAYDWSYASSKCSYNKGIAGYPNSTLTKVDGTTYKSTSTWVDLSTLTTMGDCLANGGSWNNWVGTASTTTSVPTTPLASTIPAWDYTRQAPDADDGCLHCHSTLTQYNGPSERWKDSYLKTGHKNMLRKVTPGKKWAGPNEEGVIELYKESPEIGAATGEINFTAATAKISGVDKPLLYIFGDWMAPAPAGLDVIVNMSGSAKYNGTSNYSCAACHTTGWSNNDGTSGLCSLSSKTTSATCTSAGGTWYPMIGVQGIGTTGYTPAEPAASFPGITFTSAGKWNLDGIQCARCHNAVIGKVVDTQIAASQYPSTHVTSGGMGALASGVGVTNLCFGCHQSIAKTNNGTGLDADLSAPTNIPVKNAATAPDYLPEFSGHVIGNSFLNSPHARFTGNIVPNALGKYDLEDPTTCVGTTCNTGGNNNGNASKYNSRFQGYTCWQSPTSSSPAKTMIVNGEIHEIETKTDCEKLYGAGAWRTDTQGTCATCHDVHNSLFVTEQKEAALRKVCTDCHNKSPTKLNHRVGVGTPLDWGVTEKACIICHMPRATSSGFPMHLWRINTDADYSTFPSATEFGIGATATKKIANTAPDGTYTNAVWVDVDYVCGQCHGGSFGQTATQIESDIPYMDKATLARFAKNMHSNRAPNVSFTSNISGKTVTLTDTSTDDSFSPDLCSIKSCFAITVTWGDKTSPSNGVPGDALSHTYAKAGRYKIIYSVTDKNGAKRSKTITVTIR